jgi:hypothetical protein
MADLCGIGRGGMTLLAPAVMCACARMRAHTNTLIYPSTPSNLSIFNNCFGKKG